MSDYKEELLISVVDILKAHEGRNELISNQSQAMDGYSALANFISIAKEIEKYLDK